MNTNEIILAIDAEISRLQQAKVLMTQTSSLKPAKRKPGSQTGFWVLRIGLNQKAAPPLPPQAAKQPALIRHNLVPRLQSADN